MPEDRTPPDDPRSIPEETTTTTSDESATQPDSAGATPDTADSGTSVTAGPAKAHDAVTPKADVAVDDPEPVPANPSSLPAATASAPTPNGKTTGESDDPAAAKTDGGTAEPVAGQADSRSEVQTANPSDGKSDDKTQESAKHMDDKTGVESQASGDGTAVDGSRASGDGTSADGSRAAGDGATADDASDGEFGKLLEASTESPREVKVGERVRGKIVSIGEEHCFIDYHGRAEARIATSELRDRDGGILMRVGDMLSATVATVDEDVTLTLGKRRGPVNAARLRVAFENKVPVSGTVKTTNKGGFDVAVGGIRAFCPLSQIDNTFVDDPKDYVGKSFTFRVLRWENGGRNIVVSRRPILREEAKARAVETRKLLEEGAELEGVVTRLQPFGAFVDLGGLEGLVHVSRMGHTRVDNPASVVSKGEKVRVRVVRIENPGTRKERIALALIDLGPDPWESVLEQIKPGDILTGTVARLVDFGAFVRLPNGMDGLVHVSEIADARVNEPKDAVQQGQEVQVRVLRIDVENKRISLSLRLSPEPGRSQPKPKREPRAAKGAPKESKGNAPAAGPVTLTHTMADQLGRLKDKLRDQD